MNVFSQIVVPHEHNAAVMQQFAGTRAAANYLKELGVPCSEAMKLLVLKNKRPTKEFEARMAALLIHEAQLCSL